MKIGDGIVVETEPNDNFASAYDLGNIGARIQLDSLSLTAGDLDYYRFSLNDGAYVTVETDGAAGGDTLLYLYDSNQNQLISDDDSGTGYYSQLGYNLTAGTYYVMVKAYSGTLPDYSLEIRKETVISTEPNESFETAYNLGTVTDESRIDYQSIAGSTDLDYYRFTLGESGFVTVSAEGGNPVLALYDANRQLVAEAASGPLGADLEAGTYYVLAHSDEAVNNYDLTVKNYGEIPDLVLEGNYNSPVSTFGNVLAKPGTTVNSYYPGGIQLQISGRTVTVENNVSLNCNSIRNAAILFGEDAYWGDGTAARSLLDGTVTFKGAIATLSSTVSNCITAGGIVGNNLTVNFTGAADNSIGIRFYASQGTGPANEAWGIQARGDLTVNGNFGGNITSYFDFSLLTETRWAETAGLYASGDLVFNGGISGTILTSCYTVDQSTYSSARGLHSGNTLTVTGDISGTAAALAEKTAYAVYAYDRLEISVTGTLFAGRATAGQTPEQFLALLNNPAANADQLKDLSASFKAVYGGAESVVTLKAGAVVWGDIRLGNDSVLTISSEANLYGNADFSSYGNRSNVTFLLEGISNGPAVSGSLLEASYTKAAITIDATNALNGQYVLADSWTLTDANDFAVKAGAETISRSNAARSGNKYVFAFGSGMNVEWDSAAGLTLTVSGSPNTETTDHEAPVLGGNPNAQVTDNNVSVSWNPASDNVGVNGYQFRYGNTGALSGEGISVSSNSCHLQDLSNGTYFYQIRAYDAAGNYSDWSEIQSFTVDYTPPVYVPFNVPQAEYMYGCTATVVGMLLGYYDRFGYMGYDVSGLIAGTVELNARGLDGNAYDMDAFDTVLGSAIASPEYVSRFVGTTPEQELPYTFIGNTTELNTPVWNCIADYLGTGQYWRGNGDLSTSQYFDTLQNIQNFTFTVNRSSGTVSRNVPAQYSDFLYGLDLYVRNAGYQLDAAHSKSVYTDNNGGSFSFADYQAEINAGRVVIVHIDGHSMLGYGYDASSNEIIFDDTYEHGCRMEWGGEYYYSGASRAMQSVSVVLFDTENLNRLSSISGDLNMDRRADVIMTIDQSGHPANGATGAWLIQGDQTPAWGDLSTRNTGWEIFGMGKTAAGKNTDDVYIKSEGNIVGAWTTGDDGKVTGWETVGEFNSETQILGIGDFNGNGQSDLLLRASNGAVGCFFTNGDGWNYFQSLGDEWKLCAIGDLNGDGRDDVVLKHDAGFAGSWLTQADGTPMWADLDTLPDGFEIVGTGDFDGDGTDDVLLKNGSYYGAWLVNNGNAVGWFGLGDLGDVAVEQIADFNGDGVDDLRIRTTAGDLGAQLVMGEDTLDWHYYGSVGAEWKTSLAALS